jgi:hypothetical protein
MVDLPTDTRGNVMRIVVSEVVPVIILAKERGQGTTSGVGAFLLNPSFSRSDCWALRNIHSFPTYLV